MEEVSTIGLDLAKNVFQVHGADASGAVLFRKRLRRHQLLTFFAGQKPCTVAMEACGSAHHWARDRQAGSCHSADPLRIVTHEVREKGCCDRTFGEIAARAGIGRTTAQNALRGAATLGLLTVQERRREGHKNLPNVVRIVSREWQLWIKRGGQRKGLQGSEGKGLKNRLHGQRV